MVMIANEYDDGNSFQYIMGNEATNQSIMTDRWYHLSKLHHKYGGIKLSLRDITTNAWTTWNPFPYMLLKNAEYNGKFISKGAVLTPAIDVHRSILGNEIVIESDYPEYEQNYEATKIVGSILENKGFSPMYYYSGSKSIHIHIMIDWTCFNQIESLLFEQLRLKYNNSILRFKKVFILWLRELMINCWDTKAREFDRDLIKSSHLIRCELSKNKKGYKTFIGYTYRDLSFIPYICNEENKIYPKLGEIRLSTPTNPSELIEEFLLALDMKIKRKRLIRGNHTLNKYMQGGSSETLRACVKLIMSNEFCALDDGKKRGMFILINEFKRIYGIDKARIMINEWNAKLDYAIKNKDIEARLKLKNYTLSATYIEGFLKELGLLNSISS